MVIKGFLKTTLLDYPGHVAATVFLGGCNMRCVFCHNMDIVDSGVYGESPSYTCEEVLSHLTKRKGVIDGVCISGGEPTLNADLPQFIKKVKDIGLLVKLDTNGTNPDMLKNLVNDGYVDYVAMDIKASFDRLDKICNTKCDTEKIKQSIDFLLSLNAGYEFRTTVIPEYHDAEEIEKIGKMIEGAEIIYLQQFTDSEYVPDHTLTALDKDILENYASILRKYVKTVNLRGVE